MNYEYLIFNAIIFSGPLALSFDKRVHFVSKWRFVFPAIVLSLIPFIVWDSFVTGKHWWFNEQYTLDLRIAHLPLGEWLFFVTIPYASIFLWECLNEYFPNRFFKITSVLAFFVGLSLIFGAIFLFMGKQYTGITLLAFSFILMIELILKQGIFKTRNMLSLLAISTGLMLLFNGYLTARPVLIYDTSYQLNFRLWTIPIEDFIYGYSLIMLNVLIYEKLKSLQDG